MFRFNHDNIITDEGFNEWVKSICTEINRISSTNIDIPVAIVTVELDQWNQDDGTTPLIARRIILNKPYSFCYFGIAEVEYERNKHKRKHLVQLLKCRLSSFFWDIENTREELFKVLLQFDPEHKTPDDYLH